MHLSDDPVGPQQLIRPVAARTATNTAVPLTTCPADRYAGQQLKPAMNPFIFMTEKSSAANAADADMPAITAHERDRIIDQKEDSEAR